MCVETMFYDFHISKGKNQRRLSANTHAHRHTGTHKGKLILGKTIFTLSFFFAFAFAMVVTYYPCFHCVKSFQFCSCYKHEPKYKKEIAIRSIIT